MKKEDLFDGFKTLDDELLKRSEKGESTMTKRNSMSKMIKWGSFAACLAIALGVGVFWMNDKKTPNSGTDSENNIVAESNNNVSSDTSNIQKETEKYVDVELLLASNEGIQEQAFTSQSVEIEEYSAIFYKVEAVDSSILKESIGSEVEGTQNWYTVSGHEDMQYLIFRNNNEYSLWIFNSFQSESYPYKDVLRLIYNINSSEDISEIIVAPADMDNSDDGKAIQNAIGISVITDAMDIETFYGVLSGLTCYGDNQWEKIGLADDTTSAMQEQMRVGRYLTLVTSQGMEIDMLKYTGISGMFYEYGGIAYSALTKQEKTVIEKILSIMSYEQESSESVQNNTTSDVPINEDTYQEARTYSAELTDLQNRISEAMMNRELPFVTSSAIYENPDRLHVVVTTKDEGLIAVLKAFDITGELLEIEYSENSAVFE